MDNEYAQPVRRVAAFLIDALLVIIVLNILFFRPNVFPGLIDIRVLGLTLTFIVCGCMVCLASSSAAICPSLKAGVDCRRRRTSITLPLIIPSLEGRAYIDIILCPLPLAEGVG